MQKITSFCITLCAIGVAFAVSEQLLPDGDLKKTAHIALGLLFLAKVLEQIQDLFM